VSITLLGEGEVVLPCLPPTHADGEMISLNYVYGIVEDPFDMVDQHIDDCIHVGRHIWDVVCFILDEDPIFDVEGSSQEKWFEI
jgi:hypothetical protein